MNNKATRKPSHKKRKRMFVDPQMQGALVVRCVMHWGFCITTAALILLCWQVVDNPGRPNHTYFVELWFSYWRALVVSVALMLIVMRDLVRLSNRFCGPLIRLRLAMRSFAAGEHVEPVSLRETDMWHSFAEEFNAVINYVQQDSRDSPQPDACSTSSEQMCQEATTSP